MLQQIGRGCAFVGGGQRQDGVEGRAQGIDIGSVVDAAPAARRLFGRHAGQLGTCATSQGVSSWERSRS